MTNHEIIEMFIYVLNNEAQLINVSSKSWIVGGVSSTNATGQIEKNKIQCRIPKLSVHGICFSQSVPIAQLNI